MAHSDFKRKSYEEKQTRIYYEKLLNGIKSTTSSPEAYVQYLNFVSNFPKRSSRNQMLIYLQKPDAHLVASMKTWNKFGRQIIKDSEPIKIYSPIKFKEKIMNQKLKQEIQNTVIKGYEVLNVFDMNDTKGVPLPNNTLVSGNVKENEFADKTYRHLVKELQKELPIVLNENDFMDGNGYYSPLEHKIVVNANTNETFANQYRTLINEYARSIFFNETGKYWSYDINSKELQASSVAYIVTKSFGMDTSDYNFAYVKDWAAHRDEKLLLASQENIQRESVNIIKKIEGIIMEKNITFDVPTVLDTNTSSISEGEHPLSLIQYGETFVIIKGEYNDSSLNSLEAITRLGQTFNNKIAAEQAFELMKGHISLQSALKVGNEKNKIHVFQRNLISPNDKLEKAWYFVGVPSLTNIKALTAPTLDKELVTSILRRMTTKSLTVGENDKMAKDLASRDLDKDGLTDIQEMRIGTDPVNPDTNNNGIPDNRDIHPRSVKKNQPGLELSLE